MRRQLVVAGLLHQHYSQESERRATRKLGVSCVMSMVGAKSTTVAQGSDEGRGEGGTRQLELWQGAVVEQRAYRISPLAAL